MHQSMAIGINLIYITFHIFFVVPSISQPTSRLFFNNVDICWVNNINMHSKLLCTTISDIKIPINIIMIKVLGKGRACIPEGLIKA